MSYSLILHTGFMSHDGKCFLCVRSHDLGEIEYFRLATLTMAQGHGVVAGGNGVDWLFDQPAPDAVSPVSLRIALREDPRPGAPLWKLDAITEDGRETIAYLAEDKVRLIEMAGGKDLIENRMESWDRHRRIGMRFEMEELRARADAIEARLMEEEALPEP